MNPESRKQLFRPRDGEEGDKVTNIELFFDLVFVFAVTQLSSRLLSHLTILGAFETLVLFLAVWWLWIYTSWATNWFNPERGAVRAALIVMMLGGLALSASIPDAFAATGMSFAISYVAMQGLRSTAMVLASLGVHRDRTRNFARLSFYFLLSAPLWIAGALLPAPMRTLCWVAALIVEYSGPIVLFATPGLGRSRVTDWDISGAHMAERCSLFIIIALGEGVLVTGATFAGLESDAATTTAFVTSFVGSAAMWWIYFDTGAKRGNEAMEHTEETGRLARNAYTYLHMPIVAGIIVSAVADELMLAHPLVHTVGQSSAHGQSGGQKAVEIAASYATSHGGLTFVLVACGGPLLFLAGNLAFKWTVSDRRLPPLSHIIGIAILIAIGVASLVADWRPLTIGVLATGALVATATWEWFSLNGGWQRWTPWIGPRAAIALEESDG